MIDVASGGVQHQQDGKRGFGGLGNERAQRWKSRVLYFLGALGALCLCGQLLVLCLIGFSVSGEANLASCKGERKFGR